jgi:hypothetical protein
VNKKETERERERDRERERETERERKSLRRIQGRTHTHTQPQGSLGAATFTLTLALRTDIGGSQHKGARAQHGLLLQSEQGTPSITNPRRSITRPTSLTLPRLSCPLAHGKRHGPRWPVCLAGETAGSCSQRRRESLHLGARPAWFVVKRIWGWGWCVCVCVCVCVQRVAS